MQLSRALRVQRDDVIALVGGGGKTTAMFRLAGELRDSGLRVVSSTTTRVFAHQMTGAPEAILWKDPQEALLQVATALGQHGQVLLFGGADAEQGKVRGVSEPVIEQVLKSGLADVIIVEADGARMLPFKAPAPHEPVIPECSSLVIPMVGIQAVGTTLADGGVHRPHLVADLTGCMLGTEVTTSMVAQVLSHPRGGLKDIPSGARVVPMVNRIQTCQHLVSARDIAQMLLANKRIDEVALGGEESSSPVVEVQGRSAAIILAAGASRRFGRPKLDLDWSDTTVVGAVADGALMSQAFDEVVVVVGAASEEVRIALGRRPVRIVSNADWELGQSSSVRAGVQALGQNTSSAMFLLGDQPVIQPDVIERLQERHRATMAKAVVPVYQGQRGNPVLFDRSTFEDLCALSGDAGGRQLLRRLGDAVEHVEIELPVPFDIDTPEDYDRHRQKSQ